MDILKDIKQKRDKHKQKIPFRPNIFNRISAIVQRYGLNESFLIILDDIDDCLSKKHLRTSRITIKNYTENSLFPLLTKEEYSLTMSIINKIQNPYLKFACSPDEIILSSPLHYLNPSIASEKLKRYDFMTLYLYESAKTLNQDCENGRRKIKAEAGTHRKENRTAES